MRPNCQFERFGINNSIAVARGDEETIMRLTVVCIVLVNGIVLVNSETNVWLAPVEKDPSRCDVKVSQWERKYVPYTETYRVRKWGIFHQIKYRTNYKIDYVNVWVTKKKCCDGYVESDDVPCSPVCLTICTHGRCAKPGQCECDPGYQLTQDMLHCEPICDESCTQSNHAYCVSPNLCACDPGYELSTKDPLCAPICDSPCVNGECTAPNVCTCDDGYANANDTFCVPKCDEDCQFGTCTAPNTCTCDPGYEMNEQNVCEPVCSEPCTMGRCIAPESCSCYDGYGLLNSSRYVCEPICEKACVNGVCTAPGVCDCDHGYWFNGPEEEKHVCRPFCKVPCEPYGICVAPNACSCFEGYRTVEINENEIPGNDTEERSSACEPICDQDCVNGKCVEPNVCECKPGYRPSIANNSNVCEPVCGTPCGSYSICTEPNVCTCDSGYRSTENDVANNCEPICETDCGPNSICVSPNECACQGGYSRDEEGLCKPFCSTCHNGTCVAPNVCRCLEGYVLTNDSICVPFCENGCEDGDCLAPNECRCHDRFEVSRDNGSCVKSCERVCKGHGVCVDDDKPCECAYGWTGLDCDQPTVCILFVDSNDKSLEGFTVHNETNSTLTEARHHAPHCYQCNRAIGNKSLCFVVPSNNGSSSVGCFVETESPCHLMYQSTGNTVSTIAGTSAVVTILLAAGATMAAYFLIRRHRKKRIREVIAQSAVFKGSISNQSLLPEENTSVH